MHFPNALSERLIDLASSRVCPSLPTRVKLLKLDDKNTIYNVIKKKKRYKILTWRKFNCITVLIIRPTFFKSNPAN